MTKKKILILSYFYPPSKGIASLRPLSWAENWKKKFDIVVITRSWNGNEINWSDYLISNNNFLKKKKKDIIEYHLPYKSNDFPPSFINKMRILKNFILGIYDSEINLFSLKKDIFEIIKLEKPDFIVCTSSPLNSLKLCYEIKKKFKIEYLVDFRDFSNLKGLNINYKPNNLEKLLNFYQKRKIDFYLKHATLVSAVNKEILELNNKFLDKSIVINNGFELNTFKNLDKFLNGNNDKLIISCVGTIYSNQNLTIFINGLIEFIKVNQFAKIEVKFIGSNLSQNHLQELSSKLIKTKIKIIPRINRDLALQELINSDILYYSGWVGFKGIYSGKIFEYLGAKRNVFVAPSDKDVLEKLLIETNAGEVANTPEEVCDYLKRKYSEWEQKGFLDYHGFDDKIAFYSRENQAKILLDKIEETLQWK